MITSPNNQLLKDIRKLHSKRAGGRFVAEGEDLVEAAQAAGWKPVVTLRAGIDVEPELLAKASSLGSGTRVLAVHEERWGEPAGPVCLALWGVRDPGNVGTALRSARAFGAQSVVIGPGTADPYATKAVRASMGAIFEVALSRAGLDDLPRPRIALVAGEGDPLTGPGEGTLLVGAERQGLPADVVAGCDEVRHIPIASESLNAAMAATVGLYELTRVP